MQDGISDAFIERTEERSGLSVEGQYSYSDGYFMHTGKCGNIIVELS